MATPTLDQISKARTEARQFGDGTTYALDFTVDGTNYTFIPKNIASNGGVTAGDNTYLLPYFTSKENQASFAKAAIPFDLSSNTGLSNYLQNQGQQTTGFLVPSSSVSFDSNVRTQPTSTLNGSLSGLKVDEKGDIVYGVSGGAGSRYLTTTGEVHDPRIEYSSLLGKWFGGVGADVADFVNSDIGKAALLAGSLYAGGAFGGGSGATGAGALTGTDAALADLAASTPAFTGAGAATAAGAGAAGAATGGLMTNASLDAQFIAADAAQLAGQGLSSGQIAQTLTASGVDSFIAADAAQLAAQGLGASQIASTLGATVPTSTAATGAGGLFAGTGAATGAAGAAAAGAGAGGLTASQLATAGLISGGLNLAGGLLQGETTKDAMNQLAAQQAALAEKTLGMGKFQPVGVTTRFGTSAFTTDEKTGAITPSYTLTPEAKAYQDALSGMATQSLTAGQGIMNLGQQYVGESPEAVRNRYLSTQRALLAPQQEQTLAALRNRQAATGRGGLAFGATSDGMMATNPEIAAYYNSLAQTERQLAANAETQYQNQVNFGSGLLNQATTPFTNVFGAQKGVELAAQQPLELSTNFANLAATRGAAQGANYATAMAPSLQAQYNANNYNPLATGLQGAASNPLTGYGLMKLTGLA